MQRSVVSSSVEEAHCTVKEGPGGRFRQVEDNLENDDGYEAAKGRRCGNAGPV
jgi:hypothetical protein